LKNRRIQKTGREKKVGVRGREKSLGLGNYDEVCGLNLLYELNGAEWKGKKKEGDVVHRGENVRSMKKMKGDRGRISP